MFMLIGLKMMIGTMILNVDQVKEKLAESEADSGRSSKSSSELENKMSRNKRLGREEENLQVRGYCYSMDFLKMPKTTSGRRPTANR